jgi:hypothetical protein
MTEPRYTWVWDTRLNNGRGAYRDLTTGRILAQQTVTELINQTVDLTKERVTDQLATMLDERRLNVGDWKQAMATSIKDAYIQQAELAAGGRDMMTPQFWGSLSTPLQEQYKYLDNFAREIAEGKLTAGQIQMRSAMYTNSSREAYWRVKDLQAKAQGMTEERWITKGDNNVCSPCYEAGLMGWQKLGFFGQPGSGTVIRGQTTCRGLVNCRCTKEYE